MSDADEYAGGGGAGGTRTRLPERDPARRPARPSRSLVTVVGVVVLLLAAIAFANRGGDGDGGGSAKGAATGGAAAAPTAPTGVRPVTGKAGTIPTGYAQDDQGAQSAAANYAVALVSAEILQEDRRPEILKQIFVPDKVPSLEASFDKAYTPEFLAKIGLDAKGKAASGMTYVSRTAPMGTKVTQLDSTSATVDVWCTGVFGTAGADSTIPVTADWFTMTIKLQWSGDDWKVESFVQRDGPTPVNADRKASTADEIAAAVDEFGGFTYAR
ncbi:hypothetical protein I3F58_02755 [Streptomyces sp. MUM 203J]|uniref:hypothetical protein n=1 Tax=Streptomyces sp. MUM 203J TaxID=2791990 RepID=UPI001F03A7BC|nr:hypothetical protein [Streptomyces sp. MUM 203J]MCH0538496.1 hypothetical protein [Streptomyces sp. MUM 203J]